MKRPQMKVRLLQAAITTALLIATSFAQTRPQPAADHPTDSKPESTNPSLQQPNQAESSSPSGAQVAAPLPEGANSDSIEADIQKLHLLAAELRAEVGKTYKESLSVNVLKKAKEIEVLSRSLKVRMDQRAAAARHHQK